jgi:hypothetical protein
LRSAAKPLLTLVSSPKDNSTSTQRSKPFCLTLGGYTGVRKGASSVPQTKTSQAQKSSLMRKPHKHQVKSSRRG